MMTDATPLPTYRINHGGLMRCCEQSIHEAEEAAYAATGQVLADGTIIPCTYHADPEPTAVKEGDVWCWVGVDG